MKLVPVVWPIPEAALPDLEVAIGKPPPPGSCVVLFRAEHKGKRFYCAQVGGDLDPNGTLDRDNVSTFDLDDTGSAMTAHGQAAAMALIDWVESEGVAMSHVVCKEIQAGEMPVVEKLRDTFDLLNSESVVCFVGDFAGALDGSIAALLLASQVYGEI